MDTCFYNSIAFKKFYRFKNSSIFKSFSFLSLLKIELILTVIFPKVFKKWQNFLKAIEFEIFVSTDLLKAMKLIALIKAIEPNALWWTQGLMLQKKIVMIYFTLGSFPQSWPPQNYFAKCPTLDGTWWWSMDSFWLCLFFSCFKVNYLYKKQPKFLLNKFRSLLMSLPIQNRNLLSIYISHACILLWLQRTSSFSYVFCCHTLFESF